jgi:hypothetical protein
MSELKLEAGKYYRTRDGRKAYVAAVLVNPLGSSPCFPFAGFVDSAECRWNERGTSAYCGQRGVDLIADEPREWTVYVYDDHHDGCFATSLALLQDTRYKLLARVVVREGEGVE